MSDPLPACPGRPRSSDGRLADRCRRRAAARRLRWAACFVAIVVMAAVVVGVIFGAQGAHRRPEGQH